MTQHTSDVCRLLERAHFDVDLLQQFFPPLAALMARRHQIVHKADLSDEEINGDRKPTPIVAADVCAWYSAAKGFISAVMAQGVQAWFQARTPPSLGSSAQSAGNISAPTSLLPAAP